MKDSEENKEEYKFIGDNLTNNNSINSSYLSNKYLSGNTYYDTTIDYSTLWDNNYKSYTTYTTDFFISKREDYMDFLAKLLGLPSYEAFEKMDDATKKAYIRDFTIDRILNDNK